MDKVGGAVATNPIVLLKEGIDTLRNKIFRYDSGDLDVPWAEVRKELSMFDSTLQMASDHISALEGDNSNLRSLMEEMLSEQDKLRSYLTSGDSNA